MPPRTRYAQAADGVSIAYQVVGSGPVDLLYVPTWISMVEHVWEEPRVARFFGRLTDFARLILFDRRGVGLSDPVAEGPTLEAQMEDVRTVLRAAGSERAAVLAQLEGGPMAMLFAATHPELVGGLILYATFARATAAPDYPIGDAPEERRARVEQLLARWGEGDLVDGLAPSHADDDDLRAWFGRLQRLAASPGTARRIFGVMGEVDVRDILPTIRVPTLVLRREGDRLMEPGHAHHLAANIPGARLVTLPGRDCYIPAGPIEPVIEEIEEFLTGARQAHEPDRVLATVLFTDLVGSTERAAALGDRAWRELLVEHNVAVRRQLRAFGGREVKSVGDGFLATFDGPARAVRCGCAIRRVVRELGLELRAGLHTGEVERLEGDVAGLAVNIAARVLETAAPGEVRASNTVKDLVVGSGLAFAPRGTHVLRGVPGAWPLWAVDG